MSEYIEVGQPLQFTDPNTPTRVGEIVENVSDIYNIPSPRLGMQVFVKSEKKSFVITSLKSKVIGGVDVPEAAVEAFEPVGAKSFTWNNDNDPSNMDDFVVAGVYDIKGERTRINDNLPILNTGGGHSFNARLTVLDSSISGSGKDDDKCITQVLSLSNRLGQGEVYIRTGKGSSLDNLTWENWSTLQRNVNVEQVDSLDNLKDNGIYSGVWLFGSLNNYPLTFVCVVINDYFIGTAPRRISQFVYGLSKFDGSVVYQSRVWDDSKDKWSDWEILNQKEISSMIKSSVDNAIKGIIADAPEAFDTLREIADWIANDETGAVALANAISTNTAAITAERTRAIGQEGLLNNAIAREKSRAEQAEETIKNKAVEADSLNFQTRASVVAFDYKTIEGVGDEITIPAATNEKAGVMSAEDKTVFDFIKTDVGSVENKLVDVNIRVGVLASYNKAELPQVIPAGTIIQSFSYKGGDFYFYNTDGKLISPKVGVSSIPYTLSEDAMYVGGGVEGNISFVYQEETVGWESNLRKTVHIEPTDSQVELLNKMLLAVNQGNCDVHFACGTYILDEVYIYMRDNLGTGAGFRGNHFGLPVGNGCRYYLHGSTIISRQPAEEYTNVRNIFDTMVILGDVEISDGILINEGGTYCIHDEHGDSEKTYIHKYSNLICQYKVVGEARSGPKPFGCGTGFNATLCFDTCVFLSDSTMDTVFALHGPASNSESKQVTLNMFVKNSYFEKYCIQVNTTYLNKERDNLTIVYCGNSHKLEPTFSMFDNAIMYNNSKL